MKRVRAYVYGRPFGGYEFEFFVPEDMTDDQIRKEIKKRYPYTEDGPLLISFDTEDGYEKNNRNCNKICKEIYKEIRMVLNGEMKWKN